jgi:hypothetical protein
MTTLKIKKLKANENIYLFLKQRQRTYLVYEDVGFYGFKTFYCENRDWNLKVP